MSRPQRRGPNPSPQSKALRIEDKQLDVLRQILTLQKTQQDSSIERVPDVPRMKLKKDKVYTFSRSTILPNIMSSNVAPVVGAYAFRLNALPGSTDFTNLFEQYRIIQITVRFVPTYAITATTALNTQALYTWIDQDDEATPTGPNDGTQYETLRISPGNQYIERTWTPQFSQGAIATGTAAVGYSAPSSKTWVDAQDSSAVSYYGLKYAISAGISVNPVQLFAVSADVVLQTRRPL
jgi:hypothetical protein